MSVSDTKEQKSFDVWLAENYSSNAADIKYSINILTLLLLKNKSVQSSILKVSNIEEIESLISRIKNKRINIHSKRQKNNYLAALNAYKEYLEYIATGKNVMRSNASVGEHNVSGANATEEKDKAFHVSFTEPRAYSYTQPSDLFYSDKHYLVRNWAQVYAQAVKCLYKDFPNKIHSLINLSLSGNGRIDVTDSVGADALITPKKTSDDIYLETNESADTVVTKIKKLLDICNVNYANMVITYSAFKAVQANNIFKPYRTILSTCFPKGFRISSRLDMKRFHAFWLKRYGLELTEDDNTVRKYIAHITVRYQDFVYLPETMLDECTAERILAYLTGCFRDGKNAVYFDAIYKEFQNEFVETCINNPDMLKSYLAYMNDGRFYIHRSYLTVDANAKVNPSDEVKDYLITAGVPVTVEKLKEALSHIDEDRIMWAVAGNDSAEFVRNQKGEYFHADIVHFTQPEISTITDLIQQAIDDKDYMGGKELTDAINVKLPDIKERYPFLTWLGLRDVIAYKLRDVFSFKGKIISAYGQDFSMSDVFAHFARSHDHFTLEQLNSLKRELDTPIYFDSVYANSLRINQDEFVSRDREAFDVTATDAAIDRFCIGDYIALNEISFFGSFPNAGFPWNGFLLEHYVSDFSRKYKLMHIGFTAGTPVGAIVKRGSDYETFDELLITILADSNILLNEQNALQYLLDNGMIARRHYSGIQQILVKAKLQRSQKG